MDNETPIKGFYHRNASWYAETVRRAERDVTDSISIGMHFVSGGTAGEFLIEWNGTVARLNAFDDAWGALAECADFVAELKTLEGATPQQVIDVLVRLGYQDLTKREQI